jgi:hypothetical protein
MTDTAMRFEDVAGTAGAGMKLADHAEVNAPSARASAPTLKVIVAVHGVGDQLRCQAVQAVAERFAVDRKPALPLLPLGHFNVAGAGEVGVAKLMPRADHWDSDERRNIYFAEVYWANVPRGVVKDADTLEEAKAWGRSVVSRAQALHDRTPLKDLSPEDFDLAAGAVDEIVETVDVLENLLAVLAKAGIFKFDLAPLLRDYVGDVQIVAEFPQYRDVIVSRFQQVLQKVDQAMAVAARSLAAEQAATHGWDEQRRDEWEAEVKREIYVVAHSEGTVVSYLGLLKALKGIAVADPNAKAAAPGLDWVQRVRGFMTFGSPIDKHLVLWPELWEGLRDVPAPAAGAIQWRNYYDYGDPIGFELDTARKWMEHSNIKAFNFEPADDIGFARYLLPGKAHVDYWKDKEVFEHFIDGVVLGKEGSKPPGSRFLATVLGAPIPYALSVAFHAAAVYLLYKAVASWQVKGYDTTLATIANVLLLTLLLCGVTFAARLPRLVNPRRGLWKAFALGGFILAAVPAFLWAGVAPAPAQVGEIQRTLPIPGDPKSWLFILALIPASSGWWAPRKARRGRRWLVCLGSAAVALVCAAIMYLSDAEAPLWPVFLGGLAFIYAWWVGILTFDLAFLWHRYSRNAVTQKTLHAWQCARCSAPGAGTGRP